MINIKNNEECCGCSACAQKCPKHCITMKEDNEGFLYPNINIDLCIDCKLCEKVCPFITPNHERIPKSIYLSYNPDNNIRSQSSSGGIFSILAENTLKRDGVVFGAKFNNDWEVEHCYIESIDDLSLLRGSKYVQSKINDNYIKAELFLKEGREVLFSGTPCQVSGLKKYLKKEYDNLITVDFICHGVPSPKVWRLYLDKITKGNKSIINSIDFRNKTNGWKNFSFKLNKSKEEVIEHHRDNIYMKGFLSNLYLRPSCHNCQSKKFKSGSDFTIADYWGVQKYYPQYDDDKGCSIIFCNTDKAKLIYTFPQNKEISLEQATENNSCVFNSVMPHKRRNFFFKYINKKDIIIIIDKSLKISYYEKIFNKLKRMYKILKN